MRGNTDLVQGWIRKAQSDITAMDATLAAGATDAACFHAQQAVEKLLKAYLTDKGAEFPHTHNLAKLAELCADHDETFGELLDEVSTLTPYAVQLRYDQDFWPSREVADEAKAAATRIESLVLERISGNR